MAWKKFNNPMNSRWPTSWPSLRRKGVARVPCVTWNHKSRLMEWFRRWFQRKRMRKDAFCITYFTWCSMWCSDTFWLHHIYIYIYICIYILHQLFGATNLTGESLGPPRPPRKTCSCARKSAWNPLRMCSRWCFLTEVISFDWLSGNCQSIQWW